MPLKPKSVSSFIELCVYLVDIATNCLCKQAQVLQVVPQHLGAGDGVDGGEAHNHLVHQRGVFNTIEDVIIAIGKLLHFRCQ